MGKRSDPCSKKHIGKETKKHEIEQKREDREGYKTPKADALRDQGLFGAMAGMRPGGRGAACPSDGIKLMECPNFPLPGSDSCRLPSQSPATCCDMGQRRRIWESRQHAFSCLPCASLQPLAWPLASGPRLKERTQGAAIAASSCVVEHGEVGEKERENASENLVFCYYSFLTCLWLPISLLLLSVSFDACCCLFFKHLD